MDSKNTLSHDAVHTPDCEEPIPDTLRMITPEDAARAGLRSIILTLGLEEMLVLGRIAERLRRGQEQYGFLHLASDRRAFRSKEAREEIEDALVYLACRGWSRRRGRCDETRTFQEGRRSIGPRQGARERPRADPGGRVRRAFDDELEDDDCELDYDADVDEYAEHAIRHSSAPAPWRWRGS